MGELWQTYNQADAKRQIGGEKFSQREDKKGVGGGGGEKIKTEKEERQRNNGTNENAGKVKRKWVPVCLSLSEKIRSLVLKWCIMLSMFKCVVW